MARRGFTLLELLVTLLILGIMAAVAAPAFVGDRPPPDLVDAEGRVEALFRMARDSAVRTATPVTVVVDSVSGLVWLDARAPLDAQLPPGWTHDGALGEERSPPPPGSLAGPSSGTGLTTTGSFGGGSTLGRGRGTPGGARAPGQGESLDLPATVRMELFQARSHFTFLPSGAARGDSLLLRTSKGEVRMVTLDPWTGRARIR